MKTASGFGGTNAVVIIKKYSEMNKVKVCTIEHNRIKYGNDILFRCEAADFQTFAKEAYKALEISYPKFYKMDSLSKLAFLASEVVLKDEKERGVALVFSNKSSSLDSD